MKAKARDVAARKQSQFRSNFQNCLFVYEHQIQCQMSPCIHVKIIAASTRDLGSFRLKTKTRVIETIHFYFTFDLYMIQPNPFVLTFVWTMKRSTQLRRNCFLSTEDIIGVRTKTRVANDFFSRPDGGPICRKETNVETRKMAKRIEWISSSSWRDDFISACVCFLYRYASSDNKTLRHRIRATLPYGSATPFERESAERDGLRGVLLRRVLLVLGHPLAEAEVVSLAEQIVRSLRADRLSAARVHRPLAKSEAVRLAALLLQEVVQVLLRVVGGQIVHRQVVQVQSDRVVRVVVALSKPETVLSAFAEAERVLSSSLQMLYHETMASFHRIDSKFLSTEHWQKFWFVIKSMASLMQVWKQGFDNLQSTLTVCFFWKWRWERQANKRWREIYRHLKRQMTGRKKEKTKKYDLSTFKVKFWALKREKSGSSSSVRSSFTKLHLEIN